MQFQKARDNVPTCLVLDSKPAIILQVLRCHLHILIPSPSYLLVLSPPTALWAMGDGLLTHVCTQYEQNSSPVHIIVQCNSSSNTA